MGKKATAAGRGRQAWTRADIPALLVEGSNRAGIGFDTTKAIAAAGINLAFLVAQVIGSKFSAVYGLRHRGRSPEGSEPSEEGPGQTLIAGGQTGVRPGSDRGQTPIRTTHRVVTPLKKVVSNDCCILPPRG